MRVALTHLAIGALLLVPGGHGAPMPPLPRSAAYTWKIIVLYSVNSVEKLTKTQNAEAIMDTDGFSAAVCAYPLRLQFDTCCEKLKVMGPKFLE